MLTGPIPSSRVALDRAGWSVDDVDPWEINEAFAPVPIVVGQELGIPLDRINVQGGAIALGHPLGATGAMLLGTLLGALERRSLRRGAVTLCIGYGMGITMLVERLERPQAWRPCPGPAHRGRHLPSPGCVARARRRH